LGATSYHLKRSSASGGPYTIISSTAGTNYFDAIHFNGTTFYYVVSSVNDGGESADSAQVSAIPSGSIALNRVGWVATASVSAGGQPPANAIDGDPSTRWSTGASQANGQWFQIDMGATNTFSQLVLDATASAGDYPRGYQVYVSSDGVNWGSPVASGAGSSAITTINFAAKNARYIRVIQTGSNSGWWSIHELNVYGGAPAPLGGGSFAAINMLPDNQLQLSWTNTVALVYCAANLNPPIAWTVVTNSPILSNDRVILTLPTEGSLQGYYQLQ
jgi:hypothetical protein